MFVIALPSPLRDCTHVRGEISRDPEDRIVLTYRPGVMDAEENFVSDRDIPNKVREFVNESFDALQAFAESRGCAVHGVLGVQITDIVVLEYAYYLELTERGLV